MEMTNKATLLYLYFNDERYLSYIAQNLFDLKNEMDEYIEEIIFIDNGSKPEFNFLQWLKKSYDDEYENEIFEPDFCNKDNTFDYDLFFKPFKISVYRLEENVGFAKGMNFGFSKCKTEKIIFCNTDILFYQYSLKSIVECLDKSLIGFVGIQNISYPMRNFTPNISPELEIHIRDFLCFTCVGVHKSYLKKIGDFDEFFHSYYEDSDLLLRSVHQYSSYNVQIVNTAIFHDRYLDKNNVKKIDSEFKRFESSKIFTISRLYYYMKWFSIGRFIKELFISMLPVKDIRKYLGKITGILYIISNLRSVIYSRRYMRYKYNNNESNHSISKLSKILEKENLKNIPKTTEILKKMYGCK